MSACWNPGCGRMHNGTVPYALYDTCWIFEPVSRRCKKCLVISSPSALKYANWSRGCLGTRDDFDEPMAETCTPGAPAYLQGQCIGVLGHERKQDVQQGRETAKSARPERRSGIK